MRFGSDFRVLKLQKTNLQRFLEAVEAVAVARRFNFCSRHDYDNYCHGQSCHERTDLHHRMVDRFNYQDSKTGAAALNLIARIA